MFRIIGVIVLLFIFPFYSDAQGQSTVNDTIWRIELPEVEVVKRRDARQRKRMERLEYNVRKAYPYARIAANKINEIEHKLRTIQTEKERSRFIKAEYKELMRTFKKPLMELTISQGRILIKLIYRETTNTSFSHIKEYKGGVNAYFWQSLALLFGNNLKADYDPLGKEAEIEEIVKKIEADFN